MSIPFKLFHKFKTISIKIPADDFLDSPGDCKIYMKRQKNCNSYNNLESKE